jgi:hydrogenase maturation factor
VQLRPLVIDDGGLALAKPVLRRVKYNADVNPFSAVKPGDFVSIHWGYACEVLSPRQVGNITKFTAADLSLVNRYLKSRKGKS